MRQFLKSLFAAKTAPARTADANRTRLGTEALETREVLSAVTAAAVSGDLVIDGNDWASTVHITQIDADSYRVAGANWTTVNGSYGAIQLDGITNEIRINMNGGNDHVVLKTRNDLWAANAVNIKMGTGNDIVELGSTTSGGNMFVRGDVTVDLQDGNDRLTATGVYVGDDLTVYGGGGNYDVVEVSNFRVGQGSTYGDLKTYAVERVYLNNGTVGGDVSLDLGASSNWNAAIDIDVYYLNIGDDLDIRTGYGRDNIWLYGTHVGDDTTILSGDEPWGAFGGDYIRLQESSTGDRLFVETGAGNDTLLLQNFDGRRAHLDGGAGSDTLSRDSNSQFSVYNAYDFE